ncbi:MAG: hypothetical protein K0Q95_2993 [Bacteroidota bacterium]|jgi:hypothetical protein|nr:hypothetical protein [Bacteroidota bacterium]
MKNSSAAFIYTLLTFFYTNLNAQIPSIQEGAETQYTEKAINDIIGGDESGFYALRQSTKGKGVHTYIEKYDNKSLNRIFRIEIESEKTITDLHGSGSGETVIPFLINGKIYVFFECAVQSSAEQKLFVQVLNQDQTLSKVTELQSIPITYNAVLAYFGEFQIELSPDNKNFLVTCAVHGVMDMTPPANIPGAAPPEIKYPDVTKAALYNLETFKRIWIKEIPLKLDGHVIFADNFSIDNNSNLYYRVRIRNSEDSKTLSGISVGIIPNNLQSVKYIPVAIPNKKVLYGFTFQFLENSDLLISGIIGDTTKRGRMVEYSNEAFFLKRIDTKNFNSRFEIFSNILNYQLSEKNPTFELDFTSPVIYEVNNALYVITQRLFYEGVNVHSKEIITTKFSDAGLLKWMQPIQHFAFFPYYKSYGNRSIDNFNLIKMENRLCFLFLENPSNKNYDENNSKGKFEPVRSIKDPANVVSVFLNENGETSKFYIYENTSKGMNYIPTSVIEMGSKRLLIYLENRKANTERFAILTF